MSDEILDLTTRQVATGARVLTAVGEIDHDSAGLVRRAVGVAVDQGCARIVLDLSAVSFCDSGGLSAFIDAHRRTTAEGGWFRLAGARRPVIDVLRATNLDGYLVLRGTVAEALGTGGTFATDGTPAGD